MATLLWTMLCSKVTVDQRTNTVSLIDVIEEITISGQVSFVAPTQGIAMMQSLGGSPVPAEMSLSPGVALPAGAQPIPKNSVILPFEMDVVVAAARSHEGTPETTTGKLSLIFPDQTTVAFESAFDLRLGEHLRARIITHIGGLPIRDAGTYYFRVAFQEEGSETWRDAGKVPFIVRFQNPGG